MSGGCLTCIHRYWEKASGGREVAAIVATVLTWNESRRQKTETSFDSTAEK